jgi:hypothetical protein
VPVFGNDRFEIGRDAWRPTSRAEIDRYISTRMGSALALGPSQLPSDAQWAYEALQAFNQEEEVYVSDKPNSPEKRFRTGPRFILEDDPNFMFDFNIDEIIQEASCVVADSPIEIDTGDSDVQEAICLEFECDNLAERSATSILYDSFASESDFISSAKRALERWQRSLAERPLSQDKELSITQGLFPAEVGVLCQQLDDGTTPAELNAFIFELTPAKAYEFARKFRLRGLPEHEPLETFPQRLEDLGSKFNCR